MSNYLLLWIDPLTNTVIEHMWVRAADQNSAIALRPADWAGEHTRALKNGHR